MEVLQMKVTLSKSKSAEQVYITKSFRNENGKSTSRIVKKLGSMSELLPLHDNDRDKVISWAKEEARIMTEAEKSDKLNISLDLSETKQLSIGEQVSYAGGYIFLQKIFNELGLKKICKTISSKYSFKYNLDSILSGLIYARILSPSSKLSSYEYLKTLIESPDFELHDVYRALDVLNRESDLIQAMVYDANKQSKNTSVLYYDCTNFFFEIEEEDGFRKYGKSKEHRPNPIVQMGLFLDGDGVPLAFNVFSGNENEQPTLLPLEKKIISDFSLSKFIVCTDAGLASTANRKFNNSMGRSFVVRQSLKQLKGYLREWTLDPEGWRLSGADTIYNLNDIDENMNKESVFYKERWINENGLEQRLIVTFSAKYKHYQREIRERQIDRAVKIINKGSSAATRNMNSPRRFVEEIQMTMDGVVADKSSLALNTGKISEEEIYDGFTAVCTTLEDDVSEILKINRRRWEIEESFRIMKTEFKARPVFLQTEERIRAHFLTCFLALLVYRSLERKLGERYTVSELQETLKKMDFYKIKGIGYMPCYTRTEITDALHEAFGFRTDKEIISDKKMKKILQDTKK